MRKNWLSVNCELKNWYDILKISPPKYEKETKFRENTKFWPKQEHFAHVNFKNFVDTFLEIRKKISK